MRALTPLDWGIVVAYLALALAVGVWVSRRAGRSVDREMAYPVLMSQLLPAGLLGLLFASLLAAFMSTVDTHINWGSSYLVNDLYRRFLRPAAGQRELVAVTGALATGGTIIAMRRGRRHNLAAADPAAG